MAPSPASSDEGEINETAGDRNNKSKATTLRRREGGSGIDLQDRTRARMSHSPRSPDHHSSHRRRGSSRSPPRASNKRGRDERDGYYQPRGGGGGGDPRQFRVRYEDHDAPSTSSRRGRLAYDDLDDPRGDRGGWERDWAADRDREGGRERDYWDRDRHPDNKRARHRSRSPQRRGSGGGGGGRGGGLDERPPQRRAGLGFQAARSPLGPAGGGGGGHGAGGGDAIKYDDQPERAPRDQSKRAALPESSSKGATRDAKTAKGLADDSRRNDAASKKAGARPKEPEPEPEVEEESPIDVEAEIERRRRRRDEILAKSRSETPLLIHALQGAKSAISSPHHTQDSTPRRTEANTPRSASPALSAAGQQDGMSPDALVEILNDQELINRHGASNRADDYQDGPSAADYDPTVDMKEDELRDELRHGNVGLHGEPIAEPVMESVEEMIVDEKKQLAGNADEENDDFDMFAEDFDEEKYRAPKPANSAEAELSQDAGTLPTQVANGGGGGGILEGDDKDGYYKIRIGEVMSSRYQIQSTLGKGMFSGVARAMDITTKRLVAVKIMRNNDALRKGGFTEIAILQKLNDSDPDGRKHIVKFERHFEYKGHLCMAFENLSLNLREVLRKFGNNIGINLNATRAYAHQIFVALAHMRKCSIIHADLKPDNILVNETRNVLKICDLGTAIDRSDAATSFNEITPYLVSRFYRAPELVLGIPYDYAIDTWSIGCTLYELYTGKILFTGDSNNQMIKAILETRGKFSSKLYRRGQLWHHHFDDMGNFISVERDKALGKTAVRTIPMAKPTRDLRTRLMAASSGMNDAETRELNHFIDLLDRCLALNPDKRITPVEALKHPFFTSRVSTAGK